MILVRMARSKKIAISLPAGLLKAAERARRSRKETRSEFFRRAVTELLRREQERRSVERYVQAYRDEPETRGETKAIDSLAKDVFRELPWE